MKILFSFIATGAKSMREQLMKKSLAIINRG